MIAQRFIVPIAQAQPYSETAGVQNVVLVTVEGSNLREATTDLYDVLTDATVELPATYYYHAVLDDDGTYAVLRDAFGPGKVNHTFAGWPIPGEVKPNNALPKALKIPKKWK